MNSLGGIVRYPGDTKPDEYCGSNCIMASNQFMKYVYTGNQDDDVSINLKVASMSSLWRYEAGCSIFYLYTRACACTSTYAHKLTLRHFINMILDCK